MLTLDPAFPPTPIPFKIKITWVSLHIPKVFISWNQCQPYHHYSVVKKTFLSSSFVRSVCNKNGKLNDRRCTGACWTWRRHSEHSNRIPRYNWRNTCCCLSNTLLRSKAMQAPVLHWEEYMRKRWRKTYQSSCSINLSCWEDFKEFRL